MAPGAARHDGGGNDDGLRLHAYSGRAAAVAECPRSQSGQCRSPAGSVGPRHDRRAPGAANRVAGPPSRRPGLRGRVPADGDRPGRVRRRRLAGCPYRADRGLDAWLPAAVRPCLRSGDRTCSGRPVSQLPRRLRTELGPGDRGSPRVRHPGDRDLRASEPVGDRLGALRSDGNCPARHLPESSQFQVRAGLSTSGRRASDSRRHRPGPSGRALEPRLARRPGWRGLRRGSGRRGRG